MFITCNLITFFLALQIGVKVLIVFAILVVLIILIFHFKELVSVTNEFQN